MKCDLDLLRQMMFANLIRFNLIPQKKVILLHVLFLTTFESLTARADFNLITIPVIIKISHLYVSIHGFLLIIPNVIAKELGELG